MLFKNIYATCNKPIKALWPGLLLLIQAPLLHAACTTSAADDDYLPAFIAEAYKSEYLAEQKQRQQTSCDNNAKALGLEKVIYRRDNRIDSYQASGYLRQAIRATAALIPRQILQRRGDYYEITYRKSLRDKGWCTQEPFSAQPIASQCTGFLVDTNILVTAGHCFRDGQHTIPLKTYAVVFGFQMTDKKTARLRFPAHDVYRLEQELEVFKNQQQDWAVLQLDRHVENRPFFDFRKNEIPANTALTIIGYPNGLPLKIADGGKVLENHLHKTVFATNLDSYKGNSGSPVLNTEALKHGQFLVEGILISGASDYRKIRGCKVSAICQSAQINYAGGKCSGEIVTKINRVLSSDDSSAPPEPSNGFENNNSPNTLDSLPEEIKSLFQ